MKRFFKLVLLSFGVVLILLGAGVAYKSRNSPPSHSALVSADLSPLIAVRDFYADTSSEWSFKPSVGAQYISRWVVEGANSILKIRDTETGKDVLSLEGVIFELWHWTEPKILAYIQGRFWQIDPKNGDRENWVDVTPRGFGQWFINSEPRTPDDLILISSRDRNPAFSDIYTVNQLGGSKKLLLKNEGKTKSWLMGPDLEAYYRQDQIDDNHDKILRKDGNKWQVVFEVEQDDSFQMIELDPDKAGFIALSARGRDKLALVHVDGTSGKEQVLLENDTVEIRSLINFDAYDGVIDAAFVDHDVEEIVPVSAKGQVLSDMIKSLGEPSDVNILGTADQGKFVTIAISVQEKSWQYYLFDLVQKTQTKLGEYSFRKHKDTLVQTKPARITARDGLSLPAFLSLPKGVDGPAPLVVLVHGGPASHTIWEYNDEVQFLANRGYGVLSVNYRGSTGYGRKFQQAGYGEYGEKVQDDIIDAAKWAIAEGIADKKAMAVMGASFGGYSAARIMTRNPGFFKVAIVEHAVLDLPYQMKNNPFSWGLDKGNFTKYFGDIKDAEIQEKLRNQSPITHVENLQGPLLLIAGKRDRIVGFEQTEEFVRAAKVAGKEIKVHYFEHAGHGLQRWQDKVRRARLIEDFLAKHLGGRSGNWDYIELAAEYLD